MICGVSHTLYGAMGRPITQPLVNRLNIICSRNCTEKIEGNVVCVSSFERALKKANFYSRHYHWWRLSWPITLSIHWTHVHKNIEQ